MKKQIINPEKKEKKKQSCKNDLLNLDLSVDASIPTSNMNSAQKNLQKKIFVLGREDTLEDVKQMFVKKQNKSIHFKSNFGLFESPKMEEKSKCKERPPFSLERWLQGKFIHYKYIDITFSQRTPSLSGEAFVETLKTFLMVMKKKRCLGDQEKWLKKRVPEFVLHIDEYVGFDFKYKFFVQKVIYTPGDQFYDLSDRHGDILYLNAFFKRLSETKIIDDSLVIVQKNKKFVFTGDYTDRGGYSMEVLDFLLRFKIANPDNVFLLRGNHEDYSMNRGYELAEELKKRCGGSMQVVEELLPKVYNFLLSALFVGDGDIFDVYCHGGLEPGYNPLPLSEDNRACLYQEITELNLAWLGEEIIKELEEKLGIDSFFYTTIPTRPMEVGFLWSDFAVFFQKSKKETGRGYIYDMKLVEIIFDKGRISRGFRGHQHAGMMLDMMVQNKGLYVSGSNMQCKEGEEILVEKIGRIITVNTSPGWGLGDLEDYDYDTHIIVTYPERFAERTLRVCHVKLK